MSLIRVSETRFDNRVYRSRGGVWIPGEDGFYPTHEDNVFAVLKRPGILPWLLGTHLTTFSAANIVTDAGDLHYAERLEDQYNGTGAPTNAFGVHEMCSAGTPAKGADRSAFTPIAGSEKANDTGYPKINDQDANNTGAATDAVTHKAAYTTSDFNHAAITHGITTNASPGASEPLLTGYAFAASFEKTASEALDVFVNHAMTGVS